MRVLWAMSGARDSNRHRTSDPDATEEGPDQGKQWS